MYGDTSSILMPMGCHNVPQFKSLKMVKLLPFVGFIVIHPDQRERETAIFNLILSYGKIH